MLKIRIKPTIYFITALSSNKSNSQAWDAFEHAIKQINSDSRLLPNTTLKAFDEKLVHENTFEYGKKKS